MIATQASQLTSTGLPSVCTRSTSSARTSWRISRWTRELAYGCSTSTAVPKSTVFSVAIADLTERLQVKATQLIQAANEIETLRERSEQLPKLNADLDATEIQYQAASKEMKGNEREKNQVDANPFAKSGVGAPDR